MKLQQTFGYELARSNRLLLLAICAWLCFAAFSAWTKFEATPIHMWNMFAVPLKERQTFTVTRLYADGQATGDPAAWYYFCNMVPAHSMAHYLAVKEGSYAVPEFRTIRSIGEKAGLDMNAFIARLLPPQTAVDHYPTWLKHYTAAQLGRPADTLKAVSYTVAYTASGRIQVLDSTILFSR